MKQHTKARIAGGRPAYLSTRQFPNSQRSVIASPLLQATV